jgi:hypothetical protein
VAVWESVATLVRDVEDWATLAEMEAWGRVRWVEEKSTVVLAFAHEEVEGLVQRATLLEVELAEAHQAHEMSEENSRGLSDAVADAEWWWKESKRVS